MASDHNPDWHSPPRSPHAHHTHVTMGREQAQRLRMKSDREFIRTVANREAVRGHLAVHQIANQARADLGMEPEPVFPDMKPTMTRLREAFASMAKAADGFKMPRLNLDQAPVPRLPKAPR